MLTADECLVNLRAMAATGEWTEGAELADKLEPKVRAFVCPMCGKRDPGLSILPVGFGDADDDEPVAWRAGVFCRACVGDAQVDMAQHPHGTGALTAGLDKGDDERSKLLHELAYHGAGMDIERLRELLRLARGTFGQGR